MFEVRGLNHRPLLLCVERLTTGAWDCPCAVSVTFNQSKREKRNDFEYST